MSEGLDSKARGSPVHRGGGGVVGGGGWGSRRWLQCPPPALLKPPPRGAPWNAASVTRCAADVRTGGGMRLCPPQPPRGRRCGRATPPPSHFSPHPPPRWSVGGGDRCRSLLSWPPGPSVATNPCSRQHRRPLIGQRWADGGATVPTQLGQKRERKQEWREDPSSLRGPGGSEETAWRGISDRICVIARDGGYYAFPYTRVRARRLDSVLPPSPRPHPRGGPPAQGRGTGHACTSAVGRPFIVAVSGATCLLATYPLAPRRSARPHGGSR